MLCLHVCDGGMICSFVCVHVGPGIGMADICRLLGHYCVSTRQTPLQCRMMVGVACQALQENFGNMRLTLQPKNVGFLSWGLCPTILFFFFSNCTMICRDHRSPPAQHASSHPSALKEDGLLLLFLLLLPIPSQK